MRKNLAACARLQDAQPPRPSRRAAGRVRRVVLPLAFAGTVGAFAAVASASVAAPAAAVELRTAIKLPKWFPKFVPVPKGSILLSTAETKLGVERGVNVAVKGSVSAVTHAYAHQLKVAGFTVTVGAITSSGAAIQGTGHG